MENNNENNDTVMVQVSQEQINEYINNYIKERVKTKISGMYFQDLIKEAIEKAVREHLNTINFNEQVDKILDEDLRKRICDQVSMSVWSTVAEAFVKKYEGD